MPSFDFRGHDTPELCRRLLEHKCLLVHGETGSGKRTTLPPMSYLVDVTRGVDAFVVVALPRRIVVEHAAQRFAITSGLSGNVVSYVHDKALTLCKETRVLYATFGWLSRVMLNAE